VSNIEERFFPMTSLKDIITGISKDFQVKIIEQETDKDHIHILFKTKQTINMTKYINYIKGDSSRILFQEYYFKNIQKSR
jgi:putative transposase